MHGIFIVSHVAVVADSIQKILDITINWKIDNDGKLSSVMYAEKDDEFPVLPRFGIRMFLDKRLKNVSFYGMGPQESYRDKHQGAYHALFRTKINDLHEDYIRPQEMDPILIVIMWCSQQPSLVLLQQQKSHSPSMHPATHRRSWRTPRITMNWRIRQHRILS